jgi:hypothetical protein
MVTSLAPECVELADGTSSDRGFGPLSGVCGGGVCGPVCAGVTCPDTGEQCVGLFCSGFDGSCNVTPPDCGTTSGTVSIGCSNGVTDAQSPFPNQLTVTVNEPVFWFAPFTATASGIGAFPKFFLDAAQCNITSPPEFCVTSDLLIPLYAPGGPQSFTVGVSGDVVFNWAVDPATITCPDGGYILPASIYGDPVNNPSSVGLNGIRLNVAGALFVALQCSGGQDGGVCASGEGCLSDADCATAPCTGVGVDDDIIMPTDLSSVPTRCFIH